MLATTKNRGALTFHMEFVRAERMVEGDEDSDIENISEGVREEVTVADLAAWWAANPEWRVVDV